MRYFNVTSVSFMEIQFHVKIRASYLPAITIIIIIILQFLILLRKLFSPLVSSLEKRAEKDRNEIRGQIARWGYFRWNGRMRGFSQQWPAKFIMVESDSNGSEIWGEKKYEIEISFPFVPRHYRDRERRLQIFSNFLDRSLKIRIVL